MFELNSVAYSLECVRMKTFMVYRSCCQTFRFDSNNTLGRECKYSYRLPTYVLVGDKGDVSVRERVFCHVVEDEKGEDV